MESEKSAKDFLCVRCEPKGRKRKADTFVHIDGLLNNEKHPLCNTCLKEWREEYAKLDLNGLL